MLRRSLSHIFQPGEYDPTEWRLQREDMVRVTFDRTDYAARVADINARMAEERGRERTYGNVALAAILALLLIVAITPQAVENLTDWRVSHEPV